MSCHVHCFLDQWIKYPSKDLWTGMTISVLVSPGKRNRNQPRDLKRCDVHYFPPQISVINVKSSVSQKFSGSGFTSNAVSGMTYVCVHIALLSALLYIFTHNHKHVRLEPSTHTHTQIDMHVCNCSLTASRHIRLLLTG